VLRNNTLDVIRFTAIVMMVVFHFIFDLRFFGYLDVDIPTGVFWREWRALIVSLFLLAVGVSLVFAYNQQIPFNKLIRRLLLLLGASLLVTAVSLITTPEHWVYFGVLHFIAFATLITIWLRNHPLLCLISGIFIQLNYWLLPIPYNWPFNYLGDALPSYTNDLVSPLPWLALPLFGIWLAHQSWFKTDPLQHIAVPKIMSWCSRNALLIYLVHQPVLFSLFYLYGLGESV